MTKKARMFDPVSTNGQENKDQQIVNECVAEIEIVLKKHDCRLSVARQVMYGQPIFIPVVENNPKK